MSFIRIWPFTMARVGDSTVVLVPQIENSVILSGIQALSFWIGVLWLATIAGGDFAYFVLGAPELRLFLSGFGGALWPAVVVSLSWIAYLLIHAFAGFSRRSVERRKRFLTITSQGVESNVRPDFFQTMATDGLVSWLTRFAPVDDALSAAQAWGIDGATLEGQELMWRLMESGVLDNNPAALEKALDTLRVSAVAFIRESDRKPHGQVFHALVARYGHLLLRDVFHIYSEKNKNIFSEPRFNKHMIFGFFKSYIAAGGKIDSDDINAGSEMQDEIYFIFSTIVSESVSGINPVQLSEKAMRCPILQKAILYSVFDHTPSVFTGGGRKGMVM